MLVSRHLQGFDHLRMLARDVFSLTNVVVQVHQKQFVELCRIAAEHEIDIICQKPLAPTWEETLELAEVTREDMKEAEEKIDKKDAENPHVKVIKSYGAVSWTD